MFNRIIEQFSRLPEFYRLDILRKMVEGTLTYEQVLTAGDRLTDLRKHADISEELSNMVDHFTRSIDSMTTSDEVIKIIKEYDNLSIQQRLDKKEQYEVTILRHVDRKHRIFRQFDQIHSKDISVAYAFIILVGVYAKMIYEVNDVPISKKIETLKCLHPANHNVAHHLDPNLPIVQFKCLYNILINSYITDDKKRYIALMTARVVQMELDNRFANMHCIQFLTKLKTKLLTNDVKETKFLMFGSKTPDGVVSLKALLADLPISIDILACDNEIQKIKKCYFKVKEVVADEKKKLTFVSAKDVVKFYNELSESFIEVDKEQDNAIQSRASYGAQH